MASDSKNPPAGAAADSRSGHPDQDGERARTEQQLRSLIQSIPGAIFRYDGESKAYLFVSDAIEDITGYPPEFFQNTPNPLEVLSHPDDLGAMKARNTEGTSSTGAYQFEQRIITRDDQERWIQVQAIGSVDPVTGMDMVDGVILDVTEPRQIVREAEKRDQLFQSLVQNVPGAIYRYVEGAADEWTFAYISPAIEDMTGYPPEFFLGKADPFATILHPDDRQAVARSAAEAIAGNRGFEFEHRVRHKNGEVRWVRVRGTMTRDPVTGRRSVNGVQLDVTDLHEAQAALEERETTFRNLFNAMAEGYAVFTPAGELLLCNQACLKILGYEDENALRTVPLADLWLEPDDYHQLIDTLRKEGLAENREFDVTRGDSVPVTLGATTRLVRDGSAERVEMTFRDITDQKLLDEVTKAARLAAESANRAKSTFLANMSHELRTPMNAIIGYSEILIEEAEDEDLDNFVRDLNRIHSSGEHLLALINDVLDLSKIEAGKMELYLESFDVDKVVEDVAATAESLVRKNNNRLIIDKPAELGTANADRTKVRQALFNLISNASKFTKDGKVTMAARREAGEGGDWISFAVSDTGIGIPPDKIDKIFEEFSQAEDSTTRDYGGTGLGLPISKRFCEMMGGSIDVTSIPGEGSTFTIRLPAEVRVAKTKGTTNRKLDRLWAAASGNSILVIDDDAAARDLIGRQLEREGHQVVMAESGDEGLRLAREIKPRLITLDVLMPAKDGWEVLRELKDDPDLRDIPVIMISVAEGTEMSVALGATDYLAKPVDRDQLRELLARHGVSAQASKVLVVDDDEEMRILLRHALEKDSFVVEEAANGVEALDLVRVASPNLILLDLMMPEMDGMEFLAELRREADWAGIPVVVLTAKDLTSAERDQLNIQAQKVVTKAQSSGGELSRMVRQVLDAGE